MAEAAERMVEQDGLAALFEGHREHLRAVAYRMLGSSSEADDAVQEAWLRLDRVEASGVRDLGRWLTTVVARICLDMLRSRRSRREEPLNEYANNPDMRPVAGRGEGDPQHEAQLADSIGLALLVVLETLPPAERVAFVLHDVFAMPFDEIAKVVGRTSTATRQLASRARRRVRGVPAIPESTLARQRDVVDAFLKAARAGDFETLLAVLDPNVVVHADPSAVAAGEPTELYGASVAAQRAIAAGAVHARPALVDGAVGVVVAPQGRLQLVLRFTIKADRITKIEVISDADRLRQIELGVLDG